MVRNRHGIIPARAGFTGLVTTRAEGGWDHPRSRGVYLAAYVAAASDAGSSPLARGLLGSEYLHEAENGIIPARAGFT